MQSLKFALFILPVALFFSVPQAHAQKKEGKKKRVAVFSFNDKSDGNWGWYGNKSVGDGVADMIITELVKTGDFTVLERSELNTLLAEQDLGASGIVTPESAAQMGKVLGVEVAVMGAVTEFGYKNKDTGISISGTSLGVDRQTAVAGIDLRLVNTTTGEILTAEDVRKSKTALSGRVSVENLRFNDQQSFDGSLVGKATRDAVEDVIEIISKTAKHIPWSAKVVTMQGGQVYINSGSQDGVKVGEKFVVTRRGESLVDPDTGLDLGSIDSDVGVIKVEDNTIGGGKASLCSVVKGTEFMRGDIVKEH